ncbi:sarcospan isoform X2 [Hippoglossus stenolepis]|uniref:sarcospan isoform X2 n=1 Tax=Hippoglossus stenolepis TaxID=195615 RepID=UPI00159C20CB|nr:sarcospan isoform X2 [Hippoglossus stenolepis]
MGQKGSTEKKEAKKRRDGSPEPGQSKKCRGCCFPLLVALLQLLLGVAVAAVAFLMLAISPSLLTRETPHWAGIILLYFILCVIGLVISVLVIAFAGHHYSQTSSFSCEQVEGDCVCTLDRDDPIARVFVYEGAGNCEVISGTLTLYFLLQIMLNVAQALVCAVGAFIMWRDRYQVFFAGLQIAAPSTQHWQRV